MVDGSGSICDGRGSQCDHWQDILLLISNTVDLLTIGPSNDRVALVQFSNTGHKEFGLAEHTSKTSLLAAIAKVTYRGGNTNTSGGIRVMRSEVFFTSTDRTDAQNIAILITDGKSTRDPDRTIPEAEAAKANGIRMYAIGITGAVDANEVKQMSSAPQKQDVNYWLFKSFQSFHSLTVTESIFQTMCRPPSLAIPEVSSGE